MRKRPLSVKMDSAGFLSDERNASPTDASLDPLVFGPGGAHYRNYIVGRDAGRNVTRFAHGGLLDRFGGDYI